MIRERQEEYYRVLGEADHAADSGVFLEFLLQAIYDTLKEIELTDQTGVQVTDQVADQETDQVQKLIYALGQGALSTKELMKILGLKHRPTFRTHYLLPAMKAGLVEMTVPEKRNSSKQKYRLCKLKRNHKP